MAWKSMKKKVGLSHKTGSLMNKHTKLYQDYVVFVESKSLRGRSKEEYLRQVRKLARYYPSRSLKQLTERQASITCFFGAMNRSCVAPPATGRRERQRFGRTRKRLAPNQRCQTLEKWLQAVAVSAPSVPENSFPGPERLLLEHPKSPNKQDPGPTYGGVRTSP